MDCENYQERRAELMNAKFEQQELVLKSAIIFEDLDEEMQLAIYRAVTNTDQMKRFYEQMKSVTNKKLFGALEEAALDIVIEAVKVAYNAGIYNSFTVDDECENQDWIEFDNKIWAVDPPIAVDMLVSSGSNHDI